MAERSQIDEIKDKLDILDVARYYIRSPFKNSGRNTFTICPFHNEKSPSFSLNSELGIYKCFGCGESGDVLKLIEKLEGVDFPQALEIAASRAGIKLKKTFSPEDEERNKERKRILEANSLTAEYFHYLLMKHKVGEKARDYVETRKLRKKELEEFKIGYAPNGFEYLKSFLIKKGFREAELVKWGLLVSKNSRVYDKFRNRLMFPIFNHKGEIVAFSGRTLEKDGIPKYLNSPETPVYKKSNIVYGLFQAKDSIRKKDFAIIAEGNVEPLSSRKSGIDNVVVPMGTSLTPEQLKLIGRYTENIYFAFDSDSAGLKALERSIIMAGVQGFAVKSINLGKFKDPDDMIQESLDRWKAAVSDAVDSIEYLINLYAKELNLNSADGKSKLVKKISPFIKSNKDQIKADHYIKLIAQKGQISEGVLREALGVELEGFATNKESENPEKVIHETLSRFEYILSLVFLHPELVSEITDLTFPKKIRSILDKFQIESDLKNLREKLNEAECKIFDKVVLVDIKHDDKKHMKEDFEKVKKDIKKEMIRRRILKLEESIRQKESSGSSIDDDLRQLGVLTNKLRSI